MKNWKHFFAILLTTVILLMSLPVTASANSPAPDPWFTFCLTNLPEGTVYVDLLILLPETDPQYRELVADNLPDGFSEDAQIVNYCEDDFRSYTFHYRGALSDIQVDSNQSVTFFTDSSQIYDNIAYEHQADIESRGKIRLAMLDEKGNILKVSKSLSLQPASLFSYSLGVFRYDASADRIAVESNSNTLAVILFLIISACGIALTCVTEWLVALLFDLAHSHGKLIVCTNIVSQLLMRVTQMLLLYILFLNDILFYAGMVFVLEFVVYVCEFLFYRKKMWYISWKRCLLYTVCANTASALIGLWVLSIIF